MHVPDDLVAPAIKYAVCTRRIAFRWWCRCGFRAAPAVTSYTDNQNWGRKSAVVFLHFVVLSEASSGRGYKLQVRWLHVSLKSQELEKDFLPDQNSKDKLPKEKAFYLLSYSPIWHSLTKQRTRWHGNVDGGHSPTQCLLQWRLRETPSCWKHLPFILKGSSPAGSLWTTSLPVQLFHTLTIKQQLNCSICLSVPTSMAHVFMSRRPPAANISQFSMQWSSGHPPQEVTYRYPWEEDETGDFFFWLCLFVCSHDSRILFINLGINQDWRFKSSPSSSSH